MRSLITLLALLATNAIAEPSVYLGALTYHFDRSKDYNETNELILVEYNDYFGGYFKNSYYKDSFVIGIQSMQMETDELKISLNPSLVTGYEKDQFIFPCIGKVCPAIIPIIEYTKYPVKPGIVIGGAFVSLTVRYDF